MCYINYGCIIRAFATLDALIEPIINAFGFIFYIVFIQIINLKKINKKPVISFFLHLEILNDENIRKYFNII